MVSMFVLRHVEVGVHSNTKTIGIMMMNLGVGSNPALPKTSNQ